MSKDDILELTGVVAEVLPSNMFRVKVENMPDLLLCYMGGKLKQHKIRIILGDNVRIEVSTYDLSKGRITYRLQLTGGHIGVIISIINSTSERAMSNKAYPTHQVLELACAAQRINGTYIKEAESVYAEDGVYMYTRQTNKMLMLSTLDYTIWTADPKDAPMPLKVLPEDIAQAEEIRKYFRKFMFSAIEGENEFQTNVNTILSGDTVKQNQFGYVACLPSVYVKDLVHTKIKKAVHQVEAGYLAEIGSTITDLDAEIISSVKSKNFEGYNVDAIINSRMASWLSKVNLESGPCVIVKAKVKDHSKHWKHGTDVTRLNYVKAVQ